MTWAAPEKDAREKLKAFLEDFLAHFQKTCNQTSAILGTYNW